MSTVARINTWSWRLIYAGIVLLALGLAVQRSDTSLGWGIAGPGIAAIVIGIVLIYIRSRMRDPQETKT